MSNYLRIGDVKLPTAAYAKSLDISKQEVKELLTLFEKALKENDASNHQWKRYHLERDRYYRCLKRGRFEDKPDPSFLETILSYLTYPFSG